MPNNNPFPIVSSASEILNLISNLPTETLDLLHNVVNKEEFEENTKRRTVAYTQVREDSAICLTYKLPLEASYARSLLIFLDIDDTLITPKSITFREPPYNQMIDRIKANKSNYDNCEEIISNWRLQRKVMLIDKEWAQVLNTLREKFSVFALTQMNTGQFGNIASMQEWRYEELKSLGIEFSDNEKLEIYNSGKKDDAVFYRGIFITGNHSKSGTLAKFSKDLNARFIVFVDDREKHIEDIQNYCEKNKIGFLGILFDGLKKLTDKADPKLAEFQESYLIENAKWLEDAEAYKMMAENKELG